MSRIRFRSRAATMAALTALACTTSVVVASPAFASVDSSDCDAAALGSECFEYEVLRWEIGVPLSGESLVLQKDPGASPHGAETGVDRTITSSYKVTNSVAETQAYSWSFGVNGGAGKISTPVSGPAEISVGANASVGGSGSATVTRSTETAIRWTTTYRITYPAVGVRRGYAVYSNVVGNRHEVNQRRCEKKLWGLYCYEWQTMTVETPTGVHLRDQPLGWGATTFSGSGRPVWKTHQQEGSVDTPVCGGVGVALSLDLGANEYQFSCLSSTLASGRVQNGNLQENTVGDLDSIDVTFTTGIARGTVRLVRTPWQDGNTTRSLTLTSQGDITFEGQGTFTVDGWVG